MVFSSIIFLLYFLPLFLLGYHFIDRKYKNYLILFASIFFYAWGAPKFLFIIIGTTVLDFYIVNEIYKSSSKKRKKLFLWISVAIKIGLLAYFKYANFFVENLNSALHSVGISQVEWTSVALPIGISFFTFQTITYSIDVYRKIHPPLEKVSDYLLYIMSFPQMIAGPIVRFNSIASQITNRRDHVNDRLIGFYRFSIGLAKKVLIANVMAEQADLIFNNDLSEVSTSTAWIGILAYTFQIYFDFSGYSDMAIGLGKMMGFTFPENFNSPYISRSISEFWRRWHMTLGTFMKDYLYIPLGGNKVSSKYRLYLNLWIVFLISGLWHGASWNFILWGAYHGLFLILDRLFLIQLLNKAGRIVSTLFTFFIVMMGWVIFRLESIDSIGIYLNHLFSFQNNLEFETIPAFKLILVLALIFSFIAAFNFGKKLSQFFFESIIYKTYQHILFTIASVILYVLCISSITSSGFNPFIYFRF
jgi:alginate O-acetyltransferase complex protein AlgI